jgi:hypothetical protein
LGAGPHIHIRATVGRFDERGKFIHQKHIPYRAMRKTWQYQVLT